MKKISTLSIAFLLFAASLAFGERPIGISEFSSVDELAGAIAAYFPKIQGEVKTVQQDRLTLTLTRRDGLTPGMELRIWRDGKEILHPATGTVIGRQEDEIGMVEVVSAGDTSSTAIVKKMLKDPKEGDKVRITPKKINLAIIPLRPDHPEIVQGLSERLADYGRFTVLEKEKTAEYLKDKKQRDTGLVKEMGRRFNLDAVIALAVYPSDGKLLVTGRIFYTDDDATALDTIIAMLDLKSRKEALGEIKPFFVPATEEKAVTPELPFDARYFTCSDFEGDGKLEYAFSDGSKVHIYHHEPTGWREVWTETVSAGAEGTQQINIDSADINENGKPELFVTAMLNGRIFSYVIEYRDGSYRRIADIPGFVRILKYPGKGLMLLGQAYDPGTFYAGQPKVYRWTDGKYIAGEDFSVPNGLTLYGFAVAAFSEAHPLIVGLDEDDHVVVYSEKTRIWKSEDVYPAVDTIVYKPVTGIGAVLSKDAREADKSQRVRIRARIAAVDVNGDGIDEIIVTRNIGGMFGGYKEAEMDSLGWTGARLEQRWNVKDIPGPVLDFQVLGQEKKGMQIVTLVRSKGGAFTQDREQVMRYSVK